MKVKIPKQFKIGATEARISYQDCLMSDEAYHGSFNKRTGILQIDSVLVGAKRDKTLAHELMEVIKENYNLHIEEDAMSNIANGWLEFLYQLGIEFVWDDIKE